MHRRSARPQFAGLAGGCLAAALAVVGIFAIGGSGKSNRVSLANVAVGAARQYGATGEGAPGVGTASSAPRPRDVNLITAENSQPGNPSTEWDVSGAGDESIQGFASDISVNRGDTIDFKIRTDSTSYRLDIYRMGYYAGLGARKVATIAPTASLPLVQPACFADSTTHLLDCGTWSVSASWAVPPNAVSGIYFAKLVRQDPEDGRASHIYFVVRDDTSTSDILFQTSDTTWQAYNRWGENGIASGSSLYAGPDNKATKVSYNRPFSTRGVNPEDAPFNAEYPMVRWLEANGFDVSYSTDVDSDRRGNLIPQHRIFMSVGHDEYWSAAHRANVRAARDAGTHLAFFSGNEIYWKTRWEPSADGANTPYRTLVCYKEGTLGELGCGGKCDPESNIWTGLWRDGCTFTPPADGCNPENALSGQISWDGSVGAIKIPADYKNLRFWRNTGVASLPPAGEAVLGPNTLGYEWNFRQYDASYPPGQILLSRTVQNGKTHQLSLYRHTSGALVFGAGTVQWMWGLDSNHDRGSDPADIRMQQATVNLLADMNVQPQTLQSGLVAASASTDVTPPTSSITSPLNGALVIAGSPVTITGLASDTGGALGGVEVSVDNGSTWRRADGFSAWSYNWIPNGGGQVVIRSRAVDDSGNLETAGESAGVSVNVQGPTCPCTIWSPLVSVGGDPNDPTAVELGFKFRSESNGFITAVRFYKHPGNTGTHTGTLWATDGTPLATTTFSAETASGWQEAAFATPIAIDANTTYIASYFAPNGHYAFSGGYFSSSGIDAPPLHALANGVDGPNGVFHYNSPGFPTDTFNSSNYWVDVVFAEDVGPDVTPPTILAVQPASGATGVAISTAVSAAFSEALNPASVSTLSVELRDSLNNLIPATVNYVPSQHTATLSPNSPLAYSTSYTARVRGGAADPRITDAAGNPLAADTVWTFTTADAPPPPPDEGPGGPILVIASTTNPFSRYYAEILRNEGFNYFTVTDITLVTQAVLNSHDVVILGDLPLSPAQANLLADWVAAGGHLIAMRPDAQLASLLGLTPEDATLASTRPYLQIDTAAAPGAGLVNQTIQFHGTADLYTVSGATSLAALYSDASTPAGRPAVTIRNVGSNGGQAAMFAFDLARSVVYTRQGNPAWSGQERDGIAPIRSDDLFYGTAPGDPQPDWVDLSRVAIPQADEQQRLLANLILHMDRDRMPLPRFWYLPRGLKAAVVMTGDEHSCCAATKARFNTYVAQSPAGCSLEDWECVRASSYVYSSADMSDAEALAFTDAGFELGVHILTGCADWTPASLATAYATQLAQFAGLYPSIPLQSTNRTHCIAWSDYATQPQVALNNGIRLDCNYYYWPASWVNDHPGFFTGSGMPMRFATADGQMIDCYQAASQMTDESGQTFPFTIDTLLDAALGSQGYYGVFCANMHTDSASHPGSDAIVASALARGVPVVSGRQMLTWLDGRNNSSFNNLTWGGGTLLFDVTVASGARNLRGMLQVHAANGDLVSLSRNNSPLPYANQTIKGIEYAFFAADAGNYAAVYAPDTTAPIITNVAATVHDSHSATITWTTNEPANSRVDNGISPASLVSNISSNAEVASHSIDLSGLTAGTTYYYRVTSADSAANTATEPKLVDPPLSFTTPAALCASDDLAADFATGTIDANTMIDSSVDGEITLRPTINADLSGNALPLDWLVVPWSGGGGANVAAGALTLDGARVTAVAPPGFGPGRSLEFVATFAAAPFQHIGFAGGNDSPPNEIFDISPWAIFSTGATGSALMARTWNGGPFNDFTIPGSFLGSPHRYRIDWNAASIDFSIDGALVHTDNTAISAAMRPAASDFAVGGATLALDWLRMTPYAAPGSFVSRVFDAGTLSNWAAMTWTQTVPVDTAIALFTRTGNTPAPDGSWSPFTAVPFSGFNLGTTSRYIQYRADLSTTNPARTPALEDVSISCSVAPNSSATLAITAPSGCNNGDTITIELSLSQATATIVGGQFFLAYDPTALQFLSADPGNAPFSREVYESVDTGLGTIDYASGIEDGGTGTTADTVIARFKFTTLHDICPAAPGLVTLRAGPGGAATTLSDDNGDAVAITTADLGPTKIDRTGPVLSDCPADTTAECEQIPVAPTLTALDACDGPAIVTFEQTQSAPQACPALYTITRTWSAADSCGNTSQCSQHITVRDTTPPVFTNCPTNLTVHAAAPGCDSVPVTYPAIAATDNCGGFATITYSPPNGSTFPPGPTSVTATATDACGNSSTCVFTVTNDSQVELLATVELGGGIIDPGVITRCIRFEIWSGSTLVQTTDRVLTFTGGSAPPESILAPCQTSGFTCITARDRLHTLRRTVSPITNDGVSYLAAFTGAKSLTGGNLNDDKFIDILDFGIYTTQDLTLAPGGASTTCAQAPPTRHADINGSGVVNSVDFAFIATNFLRVRDPNCGANPNSLVADDGGDVPITSITTRELRLRGLGDLIRADLNNDGVLDQTDMQLWLQGVRPRPPAPLAPTPLRPVPANPG